MGLDVYLYWYDDFAGTRAAEEKYESESEGFWKEAGGYDKASQEQKKAIEEKSLALATELGLDEWGSGKQEKIEKPSKAHPDHYFKIGYWRSSYNDTGINRILEQTIGETLYSIAGVDGEEYRLQPDWVLCRANAISAKERFIAAMEAAPFGAHFVSDYEFGDAKPDSAEVALTTFLEQYRKWKDREDRDEFSSYSNRGGEFHLKGMQVYAIMPGIHGAGFRQRGAWIVFKREDWQWYVDALDIVIETCDYVLSHPDNDKFWLHWSG